MKGRWERISFADLISERKDRFDPDAPEIAGLPKIEKIDFSEGKLHMGEYQPTKTQQIIVEPGDFVFSGLNIEKGAAGFNETSNRLVVSANYSTCCYNDDRVSLDFFKHYMRSENFQNLLKANLKKDYGFTRPKHLMPLTFLVPRDKKEQERIVQEYEQCKETHNKFSTEITHQQTLLGKLKQAILQEAIQGKLTTDWRAANPDVEPASQLLKRIQAEKARLITEKKLRPEKPLPKITPAEIPFEFLESWEWCRLGDLINIKSGKRIHASDYRKSGIPFLRSGEIGSLGRGEKIKQNLYISETKYCEIKERFGVPKQGDILIACIGGSIGNTWVVDDRDFYFKDGNLVLLESIQNLLTHFLLNYLSSPYFWDNTILNATDSSYNALTIIKLNEAMLPFPPLAEQAAIVDRVEALMTTCRALEAEIEQSRTHAAHLLQAVLKEAFAPAST